ncbi:MAG: hypothetical protein V1798_05815 [Pseudomonadota bacterium]
MRCIDGGLKSGHFEFQNRALYRAALAFSKDSSALCGRLPRDGNKSAVERLRRVGQDLPVQIADGYSCCRSGDREESWRSARRDVFQCVAVVDLLRNVNLIGDEVRGGLLHDLWEMEGVLNCEGAPTADRKGQKERARL